jgi:hypothetical protein
MGFGSGFPDSRANIERYQLITAANVSPVKRSKGDVQDWDSRASLMARAAATRRACSLVGNTHGRPQ